MGFLDKLLPKRQSKTPSEVDNERLLTELLECLDYSIKRESVGSSVVFNMHYIIILHPDTYKERFQSLPVVVKEAISAFYERLGKAKTEQRQISAISSNWVFKFGPGEEFNGEKMSPYDVKVLGTLTDVKVGEGNPGKTKMTVKLNRTNAYEKLDINPEAFREIDFQETGIFAQKFNMGLPGQQEGLTLPRSKNMALAQIEWSLGDKDKEGTYDMKVNEIVLARDEPQNQGKPNYLLLNSPFVSGIHARIRYQENLRQFQIASFSRNETRVNERVVPRSEPTDPQWMEMPHRAQILLNSIVTLKFESTI